MNKRTNTSSQIEELVEKSSIIFGGTVERLKAATLGTIPVTDNTVVVKVDEVLKAAETLGDLTGDRVTVQLREPMKVGQQAFLFTIGWAYGEGIAVQEVGRVEVGKDTAARRRQAARISDAIRKLPDKHLQRRAVSAEVIVVGKVAEVRPAGPPERRPTSFHDPNWQEAVVQVESVERGKLPQKQIGVFFPASSERAWHQAPKFHKGQEGVWILFKSDIPQLNVEAYVALESTDFHPKEGRDRIRRLIKGR